MTNRRQFITQVGLASAAMLSGQAIAGSTVVSETDALPASMGYRADAAKVDKIKFPKYAPPAKCGNCALFQGKPNDTTGPCSLFGGNTVAAQGWCNAWTKKA